jgi:hypothetical protein
VWCVCEVPARLPSLVTSAADHVGAPASPDRAGVPCWRSASDGVGRFQPLANHRGRGTQMPSGIGTQHLFIRAATSMALCSGRETYGSRPAKVNHSLNRRDTGGYAQASPGVNQQG